MPIPINYTNTMEKKEDYKKLLRLTITQALSMAIQLER